MLHMYLVIFFSFHKIQNLISLEFLCISHELFEDPSYINYSCFLLLLLTSFNFFFLESVTSTMLLVWVLKEYYINTVFKSLPSKKDHITERCTSLNASLLVYACTQLPRDRGWGAGGICHALDLTLWVLFLSWMWALSWRQLTLCAPTAGALGSSACHSCGYSFWTLCCKTFFMTSNLLPLWSMKYPSR